MSGGRIRRASAMVASISSSEGPGQRAILVPGLALKFWTMHSWMWPYRSCASLMTTRVSIRSSTVSPIPIKIPVVNGTPSRPAASIVPRRLVDALSGKAQWSMFGPSRRSELCSGMIPCETATRLRSVTSSSDSTPGLACGKSPVSSRMSPQA